MKSLRRQILGRDKDWKRMAKLVMYARDVDMELATMCAWNPFLCTCKALLIYLPALLISHAKLCFDGFEQMIPE